MVKFVPVRPGVPEAADMYKFFCPACKKCHWVAVGRRSLWAPSLRWQFNGNFEKPTVDPSLLVTHKMSCNGETKETRCHSFIRDGKIQYLADCTHNLAGQTVEIPDFPEEMLND